MSKIVKDIFLGDHTITILEDRHKKQYAQLSDSFGSKIDFRVDNECIEFRIANSTTTNYTWVKVPLEYFLRIVKELGVADFIKESLT